MQLYQSGAFCCNVVSQVVYWTQNLYVIDSSTVILSACMDSAHSETLLHLRLQNLESKQLPVCQGALMKSPSFFIAYNLHTVVCNCRWAGN